MNHKYCFSLHILSFFFEQFRVNVKQKHEFLRHKVPHFPVFLVSLGPCSIPFLSLLFCKKIEIFVISCLFPAFSFSNNVLSSQFSNISILSVIIQTVKIRSLFKKLLVLYLPKNDSWFVLMKFVREWKIYPLWGGHVHFEVFDRE